MLKYCLSGTFFHYPVCPTQNLSEKKYGTVKSHAFNVTFRSVDVNQITCNAILFILHSQYESSLVIVHNKPIKMELSLITPPRAHKHAHTLSSFFFCIRLCGSLVTSIHVCWLCTRQKKCSLFMKYYRIFFRLTK